MTVKVNSFCMGYRRLPKNKSHQSSQPTWVCRVRPRRWELRLDNLDTCKKAPGLAGWGTRQLIKEQVLWTRVSFLLYLPLQNLILPPHSMLLVLEGSSNHDCCFFACLYCRIPQGLWKPLKNFWSCGWSNHVISCGLYFNTNMDSNGGGSTAQAHVDSTNFNSWLA